MAMILGWMFGSLLWLAIIFAAAYVASVAWHRGRNSRAAAPPAPPWHCRHMESRRCPNPSGCTGPCARFESDDPAPWVR